ncbi:hypothetical protein V1L52_12305 [Treponema sp. HNW]|uniref:hypothetical protein n=1 Tax=Treponema sp. HNW TaxID=3116654 RepID=UPI003D0FE59A
MMLIRIISYIFALLLAAAYPLRLRLLKKQAGTCLLPLTRRPHALSFFAAGLAFVMLAVLYFRNFTLSITLILHATALLAIELAVRDRLYRRTAGLYDSLLIVDARKIRIKDIISFTLQTSRAEFEDSAETDEKTENRVLKLVTEKSGEIFVGFENREERDKTADFLKQLLARKETTC